MIVEICQFFFENQSKFIKWPSEEQLPFVEAAFKQISDFPGVVGILDGCHVKICPKGSDQKAFRNYQKMYSIILMGITLPDKRFSYVFTGFPGSHNDSYVFQQSSLHSKLTSQNNGELLDAKRYHIIGDSGFELKEWLLTPYKNRNTLTISQELFNKKLIETCCIVDQAFQDLKNRFRRLLDIDASVDKCVKYVVAACVIHNIAIENDDLCTTEYYVTPDDFVQQDQQVCVIGSSKRESIRQNLNCI